MLTRATHRDAVEEEATEGEEGKEGWSPAVVCCDLPVVEPLFEVCELRLAQPTASNWTLVSERYCLLVILAVAFESPFWFSFFLHVSVPDVSGALWHCLG